MKKKIGCIILSSIMIFTLSVPTFAAQENKDIAANAQMQEDVEQPDDLETTVNVNGGLKRETTCWRLTEEEFYALQKQDDQEERNVYSSAEAAYWKKFSSDYYYSKLSAEEKRHGMNWNRNVLHWQQGHRMLLM